MCNFISHHIYNCHLVVSLCMAGPTLGGVILYSAWADCSREGCDLHLSPCLVTGQGPFITLALFDGCTTLPIYKSQGGAWWNHNDLAVSMCTPALLVCGLTVL